MHFRQERGVEIIAVELVRIAGAGRVSVTIDALNLQIKEIEKVSGSSELSLRFYKYETIGGVRLPTSVSTTDSADQISIIAMSEIRRLD